MPKQILKAGLYTELSPADYHADPCPKPSLSSGLINVIIDECAARAWAEHPRNPDYEPEDRTKFDLPSTCHSLLLTAGRDHTIITADDWRTAAAKEARADAIEKGMIPILQHQFEQAAEIVEAANEQLRQREIGKIWFDDRCKSEIAGLWREGQIWGRMLCDRLWLPDPKVSAPPIILDYKTTEAAINEWTVSNYAVNQGWHIQANWYKRGLASILVDAKAWHPPEFVFVVQSRKKPYPIMVVHLSKALDAIADRQLEWALDQWCKGVAGNWTGWSEAQADLPSWYQSQWLTRELSEDPDAPLPEGPR